MRAAVVSALAALGGAVLPAQPRLRPRRCACRRSRLPSLTGASCEGTTYQVSYRRNFTSFVGAGTVCGWFVGQDSSSVPNLAAARCQIETDGTPSGGAFTARITSCVFGLTATQAGARITGSISGGTLSFSVFADFDRDGSLELVGRYTGTRFVP